MRLLLKVYLVNGRGCMKKKCILWGIVVLLIMLSLAIGGDDTQNSDILNNSLLQETNAGKNGHIVTLTSDLWYLSGGGLESTKLMFEEVSKYAGQ